METRLSKKLKPKQQKVSNWPLNTDLTNHIISFIPFDRRSAVFQSCKFLNQVCFIDFWSPNISINGYLYYVCTLSHKVKFGQSFNITDHIIREIFKTGIVNEIKLLCRYGQFKFLTDFLNLIPSKSFYEVLRWGLAQMGINQPIFETVAFKSCRDGVDEIFELLVSKGLYETNWFIKSKHEEMFLCEAARSGNIKIIRNLIGHVIYSKEDLSIALSWACDCHAVKNEFSGVQFNWPDRNQNNIDALAVVKLLISKGADLTYRDSVYYPPLLAAFRKGNIEVIDFLLGEGADVNEKFYNRDILSMATFSLSVEVIEKALQLSSIKNITGMKYIKMFFNQYEHYYYYKGNEEKIAKVCLKLIEIGERVNGDDNETIELLVLTCKYEMLEIVKLFALHGANYNLFIEQSNYLISPLHAAIYARNLEIVKYLVNDLNVSLKRPKNHLYSPHTKVKFREITAFLLEAGATASREEMKQIRSFLDSLQESD